MDGPRRTRRGIGRRRLLATACAGSGLAALAACGGQSGPPAAPTVAKEVTLQMWSRFTFLDGAAGLYNEGPGQQKKITVSYLLVPGSELVDKLVAAITGGSPPDLVSLDLIQNPKFNATGGFADLTGRYGRLRYKDELSRAMLRLGEHKGKQYQLPFSSDNSAVYWNKALFAEIGLDPDKGPETWADYAEYARRLTRPPERYGTRLSVKSGGGYMFTFLPWVWANGGDVLDADGTRCTFNSPQAIEALEAWVDMNQKAQVTPPQNRSGESYNVNEHFYGGQLAMFLGGNAGIPTHKRQAPDLQFNTALMPKPKAGGRTASFAGGDNIGIPAASAYVDQAWEVLQYFTGEDVQVEYLAKQGVIPVRRDLYDNAYFREEPRFRTFTASLDVARAPWTLKYDECFQRADSPWALNLDAAMFGQKTPRQAAADIEREVGVILSQ
jgi:multiple sugar transport system substrate-binding protein